MIAVLVCFFSVLVLHFYFPFFLSFLILEVLLKHSTFSDSIRHQSRNAPVGSAQNEESSIISGPRRKLA